MNRAMILMSLFIGILISSCGGGSKKDIFVPGEEIDLPSDTGDKPIGVPGDWKLSWRDEFRYNGLPNSEIWSMETGSFRSDDELWYTPDQIRVKNGKLVLVAEKNRNPNKYDGRQYISGSVTTSDDTTFAGASGKFKQTFLYGVLEARVRFPIDVGAWPAFWALNTHYGWPNGGEIDIFEYYKSEIYLNVMHYEDSDKEWASKIIRISDLNPNWNKEFHIWSMERDESVINLYLDGMLVNHFETYNANNGEFNPFHSPFFVIINLAIGGKSGGDPSHIKFPIRLEVDWIRAFVKK